MGYIHLLRPTRTENGGYHFEPFDYEQGIGGHIEIKELNIYGLGYIGTQAGNHVERICDSVTTKNNILLFHVGVWTYSPVEIGNIKPEEALPLADVFDYVALGHGHKPYIIFTPEGRPYAFNPGSPECVNFGEEKYDKGYYCVTVKDGHFQPEFHATSPRPMLVTSIDLDGAEHVDEALARFREQMIEKLAKLTDGRQPLLEVKLIGRVRFHPFELGRERLRSLVEELADPLHVEIKNHLSLVTGRGLEETERRNLEEIERDVLRELIGANSAWKGKEDELVSLATAIRDQVLKGDTEGEELFALLK